MKTHKIKTHKIKIKGLATKNDSEKISLECYGC